MDTPKLQLLYWLVAPVSLLITAIVQRHHLKEFAQKWRLPLVLLFLVAGFVGAYFLGWFDWVGDFLHLFWQPVQFPIWVLLLIIIACPLLIFVVWLIVRSLAAQSR